MGSTPDAVRAVGSPRAPRLRPAQRLARRGVERVAGAILRSRAADLGLTRHRGRRDRRVVALTFDDGPVQGGTERVLDALAELGVQATFFCVGVNAERHPELIRRAVAEEHVIAAHSMWHNRLDALPLSGAGHITRCQTVLHAITGHTPALYRAPWGWLTPWEALRLRRRGLTIVGWSVYTRDANQPPPPVAAMLARTLARVRPGAIILCHDGFAAADACDRPATVALVRALVPELRARGYDFVTIPGMLGTSAYQVADSSADMDG
ncbi:MAG TPA: polysaccharide deacetylase family protein [Ktedonobacterales bacterium]|nr:polysaccharide deacetylase family protein [Ktedonobacterales bacterium]